MAKLTFCIPSKNNLRYLKSCIQSIKDNSTYENEIIVYVDGDNDGTSEWLKENGIRYVCNNHHEPKGIAYGYNRCIESATSEIVCMFHADMYMAKGFDVAIMRSLKKSTIVSATRIEPPLHPEGKEKIVKNFGFYPEDFKREEFDNYVADLVIKYKDVTTKGIFAPWACYKDDIVKIGMHDEQFHSYHEDSDIFNRFVLIGYKLVQTWEAFVYHLTCRGGQFQDGVDKVTSDEAFHLMKNNAARNYIRKWGSFIQNDEYHYPIIPHKYKIAFRPINCNMQLLELLEPWCSEIYVPETFDVIGRYWDYVEMESSNTKFDLSKRIITWDRDEYYRSDKKLSELPDVFIEFDCNKLTQAGFDIIQKLPQILEESGTVGTFELDCFKFYITRLNTYEHDLIFE